MKVKVFYLRLTEKSLFADQNILNSFLENVTVKHVFAELVLGQPDFWSVVIFYDDIKREKEKKNAEKLMVTSVAELSDEEKKIFQTLKQWRREKAIRLNIPDFMICHNTELITIARVKPKTTEEFSKIRGFGKQKIAKFGEEIISIINSI